MSSRSMFFTIGLVLAAGMSPALAQESLRYDVEFGDTVLSQTGTSLSIGDRVIVNDRLLDQGEAVGSAHGVCTITDPAGFAICNVTFVLPGGAISTQFVNSPPPEKLFPIMAGTGDFMGAGGSGKLVEHGDGTGELSFDVLR